jgi:dihydrofolate reductase
VSAAVLYMSMSLDGYIAGPNDEPGNPGGDGFDRLHEWFGDFTRPSGPTGELFDQMNAFGAVLAGRRTVEQVDHWGGDNWCPDFRAQSSAARPVLSELSVGDVCDRRD